MWRTTFGRVVLEVAVAARRPSRDEVGSLGRALHVGDRLERLVVDADPLGGAARLLRMLGGDERDRLAVVEDAVDREHRLVGELEAVELLARHVVVREHGVHAGHRHAPRRCRSTTMRACACGLRSVWPQSIPGDDQVARVGELALHLRRRVGARDELADLADLKRAARSASCARGQPHGVEDLRVAGAAAEVAGERLADLVVRRVRAAPQQIGRRDDEPGRAEAALHRACVDECLLHRMQRRRPASPSTVVTSWPSACAASTRHAQTSVPSSSTEHEPHSPCSHAFFEPGKPSFSRSAKSSDSPSQQSASCSSPLIAHRDPHASTRFERALGEHAQRVPAVARRAAHVVDRRRGGGDPLGERVGLVARRGHEHRTRRRRAERRAQLVAGRDGERDDRDHHRVARADLHERLRRAATASARRR